jgi:hypothetical protein
MKITKPILMIVAICSLVALGLTTLFLGLGQASPSKNPASSEGTHALAVIGQMGGSFKALAVQADRLYAAIGPRVVVLDITEDQPVWMGQTEVLPGNIQQLAVLGNFLYAAAGVDGLYIFDVTKPLAPVLTGSLALPGMAQGVVVTGTHAFVSTDLALEIVDVSRPETPDVAGVSTSTLEGGDNLHGFPVLPNTARTCTRSYNLPGMAFPDSIF